MNISLRTALFALAFFSAGLLRLTGQTLYRDTLDVYRDSSADYFFESVYSAQIVSQALHGQVNIVGFDTNPSGVRIYRLAYRPAKGFLGQDVFRFVRTVDRCVNVPICAETWEVMVRVITSEVKAAADLFYVPTDSDEVSLDVLRNDLSSSGKLRLARIGIANNGIAQIADNGARVMFRPKPGYNGIAQISYTVCDTLGTCDEAAAMVVVGKAQGLESDRLRIFTLKDKPVDVLVPDAYSLLLTPQYGAIDLKRDIPTYTPPAGFVGVDQILFSSKAGDLPVEVEVLDVTRNAYAVDDIGNVSPGKQTEINVLSNDLYGSQSGCISFRQPLYGKVKQSASAPGLFVYEAPTWFVGVDEFTYSAYPPGCKGKAETATVRVVVSNFEPAYSKFRLSTTLNTPLVISYGAPVSDYKFSVTQKARRGKVLYLAGTVDTLIQGAQIKGTNILLYVPTFDVSGLDAFEVAYCLEGSASKPCRYQKNIKIEMDILPIGQSQPMCVDDCLWVGDANRDGLVNMQDMLAIGSYLGASGPKRTEATQEVWYGQTAPAWGNPIWNPGFKGQFADSDGDGFVTSEDTLAVSRFFGRTHAMIPTPMPTSKYEIRLEGDFVVEPGQEILLDLVMGDAENPITDLEGFNFGLNFNPLFFDPAASRVELSDNSWLTYNAPAMTMYRNNGSGKMETGFSRTSGQPAVGYGKFGRSKVVVTVDIIGVTPPDSDGNIQLPIEGGIATAMTSAGEMVGVRIAPFTITVRTRPDAPEPTDSEKPLEKLLLIFPNPSTDFVQLYLPGQTLMERIQVFSTAGQLVFDSGAIANQQYAIPVAELNTGIYFTRVFANHEVITRKFEVQH